jgi:hypothetical protein
MGFSVGTTVLARVTRLRSVRRASDQGAVLRRLDRLLTDGKVFATKRRIPGGTVLIDASGSMGWTREGILDVVAAAPAATVAIYSGDEDKGILRVLIRQGPAPGARGRGAADPARGGHITRLDDLPSAITFFGALKRHAA